MVKFYNHRYFELPSENLDGICSKKHLRQIFSWESPFYTKRMLFFILNMISLFNPFNANTFNSLKCR